MITTGFALTEQQLAVIGACAVGSDLVIEAGAGTGKSSTLRAAAGAMPGRHGLYLACTRATADSARAAFPERVDCVTAHALAYRTVGSRYTDRLKSPANRMPAWAVARQLGIGRPLPLGDRLLLTPAHQARIVTKTIERFCHSADEHVGGTHVPPVNGVDRASFAELTWRIIPWAERAWHDIRSDRGSLPFRHDHYLKLWQLTRPQIGADYLMFDEAQDANPVIVAVVQGQDMQKIAVGDSCQAIYGWRGAVDALSSWPAGTRLHLTRSFRFGPAIASEANKWLTVIGAPFSLSGTPQIESAVGPADTPDAIVCRTNAGALTMAQHALATGRRVALAGGGQELRQLAAAALELQASGQTAHPDLAAFRSWDAVRNFVRTDAAGADLAASVRLIDKHGPDLVLTLLGQLAPARRADLVVSTVHRAKGLEWDSVQVAGDFRRGAAAGPVSREEAMLAYVAVTRARTGLDHAGLAQPAPGLRVATTTRGNIMNTPAFDIGFDDETVRPGPVFERPGSTGQPYSGGRAQAESGSRIIEDDFTRWRAISNDPARSRIELPILRQMSSARFAIVKEGLGDDPGAASIRYQVLAHAASALGHAIGGSGLAAPGSRQAGEAEALHTLERHARLHARRLRATSIDLFTRTRLSGPYTGRFQSASGAQIVRDDYYRWLRTPDAADAAADSAVAGRVVSLRQAWRDVGQFRLADGAEAAATLYRTVSSCAGDLAQEPGHQMGQQGLTLLLTLSLHAEKHAIRLHSTALASNRTTETIAVSEVLREPAAYDGLPDQVAAAAGRGHTGIARPGQTESPVTRERPAAMAPARQRAAREERGRLWDRRAST